MAVPTQLVVTCVSTKRLPSAPGLVYTPEGMPVAQWCDALRVAPGMGTPLLALYQGGQWAHSVRLATHIPGARLWVASAGLGLVSVTTQAPAYTATFSTKAKSTIRGGASGHAAWWRGLAQLPVTQQTPRNFQHLTAPGKRVLVMGWQYLRAAQEDIMSAFATSDPTDWSIFCTGAHARRRVLPKALSARVITAPKAETIQAFGCSMTKINTSLARHCLQQWSGGPDDDLVASSNHAVERLLGTQVTGKKFQ